MSELPQTMKRLSPRMRLLAQVGAALGAALVASGIAYLVVHAEDSHRAKVSVERQHAEDKFQAGIKRIVTDSKTVCDDSAIHVLKIITKVDKNPAHLFDANIALAEVYANRMDIEANPKKREEYAAATIKYYLEILPKLDSRKRNETSRKLALVLMEQKKWDEAAKVFKESESYQMSPTERWSNRLFWATCLWNNRKTQQALDLLSQIVEECDNSQLRGRALRLKGDIILASCHSPEDVQALAESPEFAKGKKADDLAQKAFELYTLVAKSLPSLNDDVSASQLGMLRILIDQGKKDEAYDIVNKIQFSGAPTNDKVRALIVIAEKEEKDGNMTKAAEILSTCKRKYAESTLAEDLAFKLYQLMLKNKRWDEAFDLGEELLAKYKDYKTLETVLMGFFPGEDSLLNNLDFTDAEKAYRERAQGALKGLETRPSSLWLKLKPLVRTATAFLNYHLGEYGGAEKGKAYYGAAEKVFAELIENRSDAELLAADDILYRDLMSAVNLGEKPSIVAVRARRYLHEFPTEGKYSREVLQLLMGAYYQMDLFDQALKIAKNIFIEQVSQMDEKVRAESTDEWLKTVSKIGQCYDKLGEHEKSNTILRNYSKRFLSRPFAAQIYFDWAGVASARGQKQEAIRRYDVAYPRADSPALRYQIMLARSLLALELEQGGAYAETLLLLRQIESDAELQPETRKAMLKKLYESMLEYAITHNPKEFERLFGEVLVKFKDETWPEYWVVRYFTPMFKKTQLSEISKRHKEMLDNEFLKMIKTTETFTFLKRQLDLIQKQIGVDGSLNKLKGRGL